MSSNESIPRFVAVFLLFLFVVNIDDLCFVSMFMCLYYAVFVVLCVYFCVCAQSEYICFVSGVFLLSVCCVVV